MEWSYEISEQGPRRETNDDQVRVHVALTLTTELPRLALYAYCTLFGWTIHDQSVSTRTKGQFVRFPDDAEHRHLEELRVIFRDGQALELIGDKRWNPQTGGSSGVQQGVQGLTAWVRRRVHQLNRELDEAAARMRLLEMVGYTEPPAVDPEDLPF